MQTIKLNLYNIDELSKDAQEKAHQDYITSTYFEYFIEHSQANEYQYTIDGGFYS